MKRNLRSRLLLCLALGLSALAGRGPWRRPRRRPPSPPGGTVNITVAPAAAAAPPVSITLLERHGHVTPIKGKCTHTGGGLIDVATPSADTVVITMSGAVVANSEMKFDLDQCFEVNFDDPKVKRAKLTVEGRVIGLLRSHCKGHAEQGEACASVGCRAGRPASRVCVPPHAVCGGENLSVNDHDGPEAAAGRSPGKYTLHQTFSIAAAQRLRARARGRRPSSPPTRRSTRCGSATTSRSTASQEGPWLPGDPQGGRGVAASPPPDDQHVDSGIACEQPVEERRAEPAAVPRPLRPAHDDVRDAVLADERRRSWRPRRRP